MNKNNLIRAAIVCRLRRKEGLEEEARLCEYNIQRGGILGIYTYNILYYIVSIHVYIYVHCYRWESGSVVTVYCWSCVTCWCRYLCVWIVEGYLFSFLSNTLLKRLTSHKQSIVWKYRFMYTSVNNHSASIYAYIRQSMCQLLMILDVMVQKDSENRFEQKPEADLKRKEER